QKNPSTVSLHHRRKEWHTAAVRPSSFPRAPSLQPLFAVTDRSCFLELGVRRLCLFRRFRRRLFAVHVRVFVQPSSSFAFFA
ncbi:hypothetical protein S245_067548, partial [Arachis hypogaea]